MNNYSTHLRHGLALAATTLLVGCAGQARVQVPEAIAASPGQTLAMIVAAKGVQIYECRTAAAGPASAAPQWTFVAPEAELFDAKGRTIGSHGAGPHWTFDDGARIEGRVLARAEAPTPGAIPWLLLQAKPASAHERFADLRAIQRIHTAGGAAPAEACTTANTGSQLRVPYTADYLFYSGR